MVAQAAADADRDAPYLREVVPTTIYSEDRVRPIPAEPTGTLSAPVETVSEILDSKTNVPASVMAGWCPAGATGAATMGGCDPTRNVQERVELEGGVGGTKSTTCSLVSSTSVSLVSFGIPFPIPGIGIGPSLTAVVTICDYGEDCGTTIIFGWVT